MKKVAIIGYGFVGKGMHKIFPDAMIYDPKIEGQKINEIIDKGTDYETAVNILKESIGEFSAKEKINEECDLAIVCVPTPPIGMNGEQRVNEDENNFLGVDLSIVEETIEWLKTKYILIKSTIPPKTTDRLKKKFVTDFVKDGTDEIYLGERKICFSPEYMGEGNYYTPPNYPDPLDPRKHDFMIIGGDKEDCQDILSFFIRKLGPAKKYYIIDAVEAECIKYMENTWGATKVSFCNTWYDICKEFGASYEKVREGFLMDSRTEPMHTAVFKDKRGFGGKCYPKDLMGIIALMDNIGYSTDLLKAVWNVNKKFTELNEK